MEFGTDQREFPLELPINTGLSIKSDVMTPRFLYKCLLSTCASLLGLVSSASAAPTAMLGTRDQPHLLSEMGLALGDEDITKETFADRTSYALLSPDGTRVLTATDRKSTYAGPEQEALDACRQIVNHFSRITLPIPHYGGFSLQFEHVGRESLLSPASRFTFSSSPEGYRLHSDKHGGRMLFMLGKGHPREWVVWDSDVSTHGEWEVLQMIWDGKRVKLKGHEGQYVRWNVAGFVATYDEGEATEFVLREV